MTLLKDALKTLPFFLLLLLLSLYKLDYQSIWLDEFSSLDVSSSLERIVKYCKAFPEQHPFYYLMVLVTGSYRDVYSLRLLSAVFGALAVFPIFFIARKLFSERVAYLTCLFFSTSPFVLYYSQEGRMYSLHLLLCSLQVMFFLEWVNQNKRKSILAGLLVFSFLSLYTHLFSVFLLFTEALWYTFNWKNKVHPKQFLLTFTALGISYLPWIIFIGLNMSSAAQSWKGAKHIIFGAPYNFFRFIYGYAVSPLNSSIKQNMSINYFLPAMLLLVICMLPTIINVIKYRVFTRENSIVLLLSFLPLALVLLLSPFKNMIGERYLLFSTPFLFMSVAAISTQSKTAFISFLLPFFLSFYGLTQYFTNPEFGKINTKAAAQFLLENSDTNSTIVCHPGYSLIGPIQQYLKGARKLESYSAETTALTGSSDLWTIEEIIKTDKPINLTDKGYKKTLEKIWDLENGIRIIKWQS